MADSAANGPGPKALFSTRRRLAGLLLILVVGLASWVGVSFDHWLAELPLQVSSEQQFRVRQGDNLTVVANRLSAAGHLESPWPLKILAKARGNGDRILAGDYRLSPGDTVADLLGFMQRGETIKLKVTVIEGMTFRQLLDLLHSTPGIKATTDGLTTQEAFERLGVEAAHYEGQFFPDTYLFDGNTTDVALLQKMFEAMQQRLHDAWANRSGDLQIDTIEQALILASVIEKESGGDSERRKISGVFHRRLKLGMRLQADSTIIYGLGDAFDGDIKRRDLRFDTPYNSYLHHGLPPTPIALPGAASINAAVSPEAGDSLYFVARGDGSHHFSATLQEHNRAVRRYQLGGQ